MRALVIAILGSFLVISPVIAQPEEEERPAPATLEELQARIAEVLEETETPGVGLALVGRDEVLFTGGIGVADRETGEPVTADTVFRIGSIGKSFVALAALILVEEGLLDLDTPVRELAPEIEFDNPWRDTDPVRVVHLLEHTTGWDDLALRDYAHNVEPPITLREALDYNPKTLQPEDSPLPLATGNEHVVFQLGASGGRLCDPEDHRPQFRRVCPRAVVCAARNGDR